MSKLKELLSEQTLPEVVCRMPRFQHSMTLSCPMSEVFDFLCQPANLVEVTPPDFNMRLVEGPEQLSLGARVVVQGRRWGFAQRIVTQIIALEPNHLLVDEQVEGIFKKFVHTHRLEEVPGGTRMDDEIEFEAPGGMLGFLLTADTIQAELEDMFVYRTQRIRDLLEGRSTS
jgi:ligand-binding SRPBCC domain-containing protein